MARTRVRWGRVAGLAAAVTLAVGAASGAAHAGDAGGPRRSLPRETTSRSYVVRPGDTLWAIAAGGAQINDGFSLTVGPQDTLLASGQFTVTASFGGAALTGTVTTPQDANGYLVAFAP